MKSSFFAQKLEPSFGLDPTLIKALSEGLGNSKLVLCKAPEAFRHDILIPIKSFHNFNLSDEIETLKAKLTFAPSVKILIVVK